MIRLTKAPLQEPLASRHDAWNEEYLRRLEDGEDIPESLLVKYRDPALKEVIRAETFDKCAYCESKVPHTAPGDVEHILPKSAAPKLALSFPNLTYACSSCNNAKGAYHDPADPLVNPYEDDPERHLIAVGPLVTRRPGDRKGRLTALKLRLDRDELVDRRRDRLESVMRLADEYEMETSDAVRRELRRELLKEAERCKEYSFVVQEYLRTQLGLI